MAYIRPSVYKEITDNNIDDVVFQDPFQEETRKAKRNLVVASFGALLIATLELQVNGFLGIQTVTGAALGAAITKGLACITVLYFLASFAFSAFVDYSAWKFKRERYLVKPYLELISMLEAHVQATGEQVNNATHSITALSFEKEMQAEIELQRSIRESLGQLNSIKDSMDSLHEEIRPLLAHWSKIVERTKRLTWRLRARFASLWILDILVPILLAGFAIWKTYSGLASIASKVAG